jgi:AbrB family looped-hinge helix DNA binding protein
MSKEVPATKIAEELWKRPEGATMAEVIEKTGGPRFNHLKKLAKDKGYIIRKKKEGGATRYFAIPPTTPRFDATVTRQGQVTIPKEIREHLGLRAGSKVRFKLEDGKRVVLAPANLSVTRLFGILGKPPRSATLKEMDEGIKKAVVERYLRAK